MLQRLKTARNRHVLEPVYLNHHASKLIKKFIAINKKAL